MIMFRDFDRLLALLASTAVAILIGMLAIVPL
jgi:hypothetical protein